MKVLKVAVVGSGPAGLYTAEALVKHAAALPEPVRVRVDVLDRLPTPYGLVRYGVAPDHKSIKSIAEYLRKVLESPDVRFLGGVHFGEDVTREDLLSAYDAVVYATGAMRDRRLGIPGEDLPGSYAATDFVNWYCGHPDVGPARSRWTPSRSRSSASATSPSTWPGSSRVTPPNCTAPTCPSRSSRRCWPARSARST